MLYLRKRESVSQTMLTKQTMFKKTISMPNLYQT